MGASGGGLNPQVSEGTRMSPRGVGEMSSYLITNIRFQNSWTPISWVSGWPDDTWFWPIPGWGYLWSHAPVLAIWTKTSVLCNWGENSCQWWWWRLTLQCISWWESIAAENHRLGGKWLMASLYPSVGLIKIERRLWSSMSWKSALR